MDLKSASKVLNDIMKGERVNETKIESLSDFFIENNLEKAFLVFLASIHTKGETHEELQGLIKSLRKLAPPKYMGIDPEQVLDVSSTGASKIKIGNISTAASFIIAAAGEIYVCKQSFYGITSSVGSADLLSSIGINVNSFDYKKIEDSLNKHNLSFYNVVSLVGSPEKTGALSGLISLYGEEGIKVNTPMNIVAPLSNPPLEMRNRLYGVYDPTIHNTLSKSLRGTGIENFLICSSEDGLDELSNFSKNICTTKYSKHMISPEEVGIRRSRLSSFDRYRDIPEEKSFIKVIYGMDEGPMRGIVELNSGAGLYLMGKSRSIKEGVDLARKLIDKGYAKKKLRDFVKDFGDKDKLYDLERDLFGKEV